SEVKQQVEITEVACLESDLQNGQMKEVEVGQQKVLLVRGEAGFSAVGGLCSHYGAPLVKGALLGDRVRCPWHGACFNIKTGDIEDYPGLDCLPAYKVKVDDGKVYVTIKNKMTKRVKEMGGRVPDVCHTVMLIGGGPASLVCAETLRQNSYGGRIVIVTKEELLPFDKPKLSKALNVERLFNHIHNGTVHGYNQLLIATGGRGRDLIHWYQLASHTQMISCSVGMEVAAYLSDKAAIVSVIGTSDYAYQMSLGPAVGKMAMQILKDQNVKFYMKDGVSEIRGENGKVKEVLLKCGSVLDADVVVLGIGVTPNSDFLKGSQIATDSKSHVVVDKFMRTNVPDIFSAGDVASFPLTLRQNLQVNIAHWQMAHAHGRIAALNMLNKPTEMNSVPFFWTMLKGKSVRYAGYGEGYTQIVFKGNVEEQKFLAFYIKEGVVVAAASMNFDPAVARLAEMMATGRTITKAQAESDDLSWLQMP
uniref:Rieske domain-containing protein n=1 Tax=Denticeps clupeoides TaxID=299321 RepID=A0AAY4D135_9TELE